MAKVNQGYPDLLGGVTQQDPVSRKANQHWTQTNMLADPRRGLTRRPGTRRVAESAAGTPASHPLPTTSGTRGYDFRVRGVDYTLIAPFEGNTQSRGSWPAITCVKKDPGVAGGSIIPVTYVGNSTRTNALKSRGIAAAASLGSVLVMSCLDPAALPAYTTEYQWQTAANMNRHVVWIRGGAYSRTFAMSLVRGNQKLRVEYTTLSASYPEVLDTSYLDPAGPDYLKKVNDATNVYNTAATQWVGAALADATPENVAQQLASALSMSGFLSPGSTVEVTGSTICITDDEVDDVEIDDGGDNNLMRGVGNTVTAAELLSVVHYPGKIVRVRPNAATDGNVFFMQAVAKDGSAGAFTTVSWEEAPGVKFTPTEGLFYATVDDDVCYVASSPASLRTAAGIEFPDFIASVAGDAVTSPVPKWLDEGITYLGLFQDRLIVGGRNEVATSKTGDYLNFWRGSVLTVAKNDPVRFIIIGGEDDILRHSAIYDRNLVIFGDKRQYLIDGRRAFEPNTASATVMASFPDAVGAPPVLNGNFLFYARGRDGITTLHKFAPGQIQESPESTEVSDNLEDYIEGNPIEVVAGTLPNCIYIRTDARPNTIYTYSFVEDQTVPGKQMGAWSKWEFNSLLGPITGMTLANGFLYLTCWRNSAPGTGYVVLDRQTLTADNVAHPFLDSATARGPAGHDGPDDPEYGQPALSSVWTSAGVPVAGYAVAYGAAYDYVGTFDSAVSGVGSLSPGDALWEGFLMDSSVTLSSPFFRDGAGKPMLEGRMTVGNVKLRLTGAGGVSVAVRSGSGQDCWKETLHGYVVDPTPTNLDDLLIGPPCATAGGALERLAGDGPGANDIVVPVDTLSLVVSSPGSLMGAFDAMEIDGAAITQFGYTSDRTGGPTDFVIANKHQSEPELEAVSVEITDGTDLTGLSFLIYSAGTYTRLAANGAISRRLYGGSEDPVTTIAALSVGDVVSVASSGITNGTTYLYVNGVEVYQTSDYYEAQFDVIVSNTTGLVEV